MRRRQSLVLVLAAGVALIAQAACTDAGLQPTVKDHGPALDDKLRIEAHVCTVPAADAVFPVKILFIVDTSDSMSVTDRGGVRAQAVADVLTRYAGNPAVQFGVIAFDSRIDVLTPGFTNTPDIARITQRLATADRLTDYQGALGAGYAMLSQDMQKSSPAERTRSKYVIIFFSDGVPDPQCSAETTACAGATTCAPGTICKVGVCKPQFNVCTVAKEDWATAFNPPVDPKFYPDLQAGGDYNLPSQIYHSVDQIIGLQDFYHVGEIRLHTGFLFDLAAATDPLAAPFALDRPAGKELLTNVAMHGNGTFTEFLSGSKISFLNFNYAALKEESAMAAFYALNLNTIPGPRGILIDSDGDGIDDDHEFDLSTCSGLGTKCTSPADTDHDGYNDFLEDANRPSGFDPLDPLKPAQNCVARGDSDGDGLRDCEEAFLGTDPRLVDSDGDRIPDLLEVKFHLNPLDPSDAEADDDHDGIRNIDEIRLHTDPHSPDTNVQQLDNRYVQDVTNVTHQRDGSTCYDVAVHNIRLVTTGRGSDGVDPVTKQPLLGRNRILVTFDQAPLDRPLDYGVFGAACLDVRYVDGFVKYPPSGVIQLDGSKLKTPSRLDPTTDCLDYTGQAGGM